MKREHEILSCTQKKEGKQGKKTYATHLVRGTIAGIDGVSQGEGGKEREGGRQAHLLVDGMRSGRGFGAGGNPGRGPRPLQAFRFSDVKKANEGTETCLTSPSLSFSVSPLLEAQMPTAISALRQELNRMADPEYEGGKPLARQGRLSSPSSSSFLTPAVIIALVATAVAMTFRIRSLQSQLARYETRGRGDEDCLFQPFDA